MAVKQEGDFMNILDHIQTPKYEKLKKSLFISAGAILVVIILKWLFPTFDWVQTETAILVAISGWIINTVKESLK